MVASPSVGYVTLRLSQYVSPTTRIVIVPHTMNQSRVTGTLRSDDGDSGTEFAEFCAGNGPLVLSILQEKFPDPPREDLIPLLQAGILKKLWAQRPAEVEPLIRRTAHVALLLHRHREGLLAVEALAADLGQELRSCFLSEFSCVPFGWEDIQPKLLEKLARSSPSVERAAEFNAYARTIVVNLVTDELRRREREVLEADLGIDGDNAGDSKMSPNPLPRQLPPKHMQSLKLWNA